MTFLTLNINAQYFGGIGNGFGNISTPNINLSLVDSLYNGAQGNGYVSIINPAIDLSMVDSLYNGGIETGFFVGHSNLDLSIQDSLYNGGIGKGDNQLSQVLIRLSPCNDNLLVWNGNSNVFWNNANNWDCGTVPINTSIVIISSEAIRMPLILNPAIASKLTLMNTATINLFGGSSHLTLTGN